jgi:SPP1 family predicted phage head-tail adaptor
MRAQQVGMYRQRVTLQDLVETIDSYGQAIQTWTTLRTMWAEVRFLRGQELPNIRQTWATATHIISCRWQGSSVQPSPRMRFVLGKDGRVMNILSRQNIEERNRKWEFICEENVQ